MAAHANIRDNLDPDTLHQLMLVEREIKIAKARTSLQDFIEYCMIHPDFPQDTTKSKFDCQPHHRLIIDMFEAVERGGDMRSALSVPPQHGKTTCTTLYGVAWALARTPHMNIIVGTYSEPRAEALGDQVRMIIQSQRFKDVFPEFELRKGAGGKSFLGTKEGGGIIFAGRGSAVTGNPCDLFVIDDPIKDHMEANSPAVRVQCWEWYCAVVFSRCHSLTRVMIIHTRWTEDDLIGRLCDPSHSNYDKESAGKWRHVNLPAIIDDEEISAALNIPVGMPLWAKKFSIELLNEAKRQNPETFSALYMGKPVPDEGDFFRKEMIVEYTKDQLPPKETLRIYAASDHSLGKKERADFTVLLICGVDAYGNIWLLDCIWAKLGPEKCVDSMCDLMEKWAPMTWWAGRDHIVGTLGPFLKKRMVERKLFKTYVQEVSERGDKQQKAQSIRGRMSMGMVKFPKDAPWMVKAKRELLKFDKAGHDDFVDTISKFGQQLDAMFNGYSPQKAADEAPKIGTLAWVKWASDHENRKKAADAALKGW